MVKETNKQNYIRNRKSKSRSQLEWKQKNIQKNKLNYNSIQNPMIIEDNETDKQQLKELSNNIIRTQYTQHPRENQFTKIESDKQAQELNYKQFKSVQQPWNNLSINLNHGPIMIVGNKSTGKSYLTKHILHTMYDRVCVIDCDLANNSGFPGCVTLSIPQSQQIIYTQSIYIGQYTPLTNLQYYIKAIQILYQKYHQYHFNKTLILATMYYMGSINELMLINLYKLVNPTQIILLYNQLPKLNLSFLQPHSPVKTYHIEQYCNLWAKNKCHLSPYESHIKPNHQINNVQSLIQDIYTNKSWNSLSDMQVFTISEQYKISKIATHTPYNMNLLMIGYFQQGLFRVKALGYLRGVIYIHNSYYRNIVNSLNDYVAILSPNLSFQKSFYHINQTKLAMLQLQFGQIQHMAPVIKALGSKGIRNNPAKKIADQETH